MLQNGKDVWQWINDGAILYICGDAKKMAKSVNEVLHTIVEKWGGHSTQSAREFIKLMRKNKRYLMDVY